VKLIWLQDCQTLDFGIDKQAQLRQMDFSKNELNERFAH
jgi:hypothetical protein